MTTCRNLRRAVLPALLAAGVAAIFIATQLPVTAAGSGSRTYTLDADFDEGIYSNVVHSTPDQLQLDETTTPFGFIWVAVSTKGTAVKIDTETGAILGEYRTTPAGVGFGDPSRTTVDKNGNVWIGNRARGSFVKIGLLENNQCVDRNGNGTIETSGAQNDIRPWPGSTVATAEDECILLYTQTANSDGRHVSVDANNDVWVSGVMNRVFQKLDGDTGAILATQGPVGFGGYGGLMDANGVIWSANRLLRWNVANPLSGPSGGNWTGYGHDSYGLCIDSQGNVWNTSLSGNTIRKFNPSGVQIGIFGHGNNNAQGCVVDANDHVWVAHSILGPQNSVGHLLPNGTFVGNVTVGLGPTGVAVDRNGKIWATNYNSGTVSRIDPNAGPIVGGGHVGAVDLTTVNLGGSPYNYSDMTGSTLIGAPNSGTWTVVHDSAEAATEWGTVSWNAQVTDDGSIAVNVASSEDGVAFSAATPATNGADFTVPDGRYLRISVVFTRASNGDSPILFDLTVRPANAPPVAVCQDVTVSNDAGQCSANVAAEGLDGGSSDPDGDTITFSANPAGPYAVGATSVELTVTDPSSESDSCEAIVTVNDAEEPTITCSAPVTVECTGPGGAAASFSAGATDNCSVASVDCPGSGDTYALGMHNVSCTATDASGNTSSCGNTVTVIDTTRPLASCVESHNPSGNNVPGAKNEDGFYTVGGADSCSGTGGGVTIAIGSHTLAQGETIKITQAPGSSGVTLVNTMGPEAIKHFRVGPGDAVITVTDGSGNSSSAICLVPPPPK